MIEDHSGRSLTSSRGIYLSLNLHSRYRGRCLSSLVPDSLSWKFRVSSDSVSSRARRERIASRDQRAALRALWTGDLPAHAALERRDQRAPFIIGDGLTSTRSPTRPSLREGNASALNIQRYHLRGSTSPSQCPSRKSKEPQCFATFSLNASLSLLARLQWMKGRLSSAAESHQQDRVVPLIQFAVPFAVRVSYLGLDMPVAKVID